MDINEAFQHKVCINLARRSDRWESMQLKFDLHGIRDVRRLPAIDGNSIEVPSGWPNTRGAYGCLLSHVQAVRDARDRGLPNLLIFEDDVVFDPQLQQRFQSGFADVPSDWQVLYFGVLHMEDPVKISPNIHRVRKAYSTYAYALNRPVFETFIELNSKATSAVDANALELQRNVPCYCFAPHLAWVEHDYSDAQEQERHHWYLKESLVIRGGSMDQLLNKTSVIIAHCDPAHIEGTARNLRFLTRFYSERLRGINVTVVEQRGANASAPLDLPKGCRHIVLKHHHRPDKALCFNAGIELSPADHSHFIFSDSRTFLEEWDVCGNLRMCDQYHCTTGFKNLIGLSETGTRRLISDRLVLMRWFNSRDYVAKNKNSPFDNYCLFTRDAITSAGGWDERSYDNGEHILSPRSSRELRIFEAPNDALLLHSD
ncbi:MAG TPA: glycosyltransferase family 25 protein [Blastocatellia bacterium]|nr:glycosyltransferase family 25 protein [Blastocatellia bacterium]